MKESALIVGIGETRIGRQPDRTGLELQAEAVRLAVQDAGLAKKQIDAVYSLGSYIQPIMLHAASLSEYLGLQPRFQGTFDVGGTPAFIAMALDAIAAVEAGRVEAAVCVYGDNAATRRPPGSHGFVQQIEYGTEDYEDPFGQTVLVSYALLARRYLDHYGLDAESAFWPIASAMRQNAQLNDNAAYRKQITIDDYRASDFVADPLRKADCSPLTDGAGAFVVTSSSLARRGAKGRVPVSVLGTGMQMTHKIISTMPDEIDDLGFAAAGDRAFAEAGLARDDVDVVTVHDGFTVSVPITLEQLGLCPPGECSRMAAAGELQVGGSLPTNTHGGLLAGHVGGILHVVEAVRQLRGEAGPRQIADAEVALVAGNGGVLSICGAMLLGRGS